MEELWSYFLFIAGANVFDEINVFNFGVDESRPPPDLDFDFVPEPEKKCCQIL